MNTSTTMNAMTNEKVRHAGVTDEMQAVLDQVQTKTLLLDALDKVRLPTEAVLWKQALVLVDKRPLAVDVDAQGDALVDFSILESVPNLLVARLLTADRSPVLDRCRAAMIGMAMGDAVGAALEFMPVVDTPGAGGAAANLQEPSFFTGSPVNSHNVKPGQWTDDTSMGLCLADSLLVHSQYNGSDFNARLWSWYRCGYNNAFQHESDESRAGESAQFYKEAMLPIRESIGAGGGIKKALNSLRAGMPLPAEIDLGTPEDGNAALIRLAPVPVFCASQSVQACVEMAKQSCRATSSGHQAAEAAGFMSYLMHSALNRSGGASIKEFLDEMARAYSGLLEVRAENTAVQMLLRFLSATEPTDSSELCWNWRGEQLHIHQTLKNRGPLYNGYPVSDRYFGSYAFDGLAVALWAVYHSTCATDAIVRAANLLGDADSTACIAGQIAGAFYGSGSFQGEYLAQIRRWDPRAEIELRGVLLFELGSTL